MVSFFRYTKTKTAWRMVDGPFGLRETKEMRDSRGIAALYSPSPKSPKKKKKMSFRITLKNMKKKIEMQIILF